MDTIPVTKKLIAFGTKQIFLPKFTIALVRTPYLSPYHARFLVPLDFSKYDLRDYLAHAYNVRAFNIRSFVKQMPVRDTQSQPRHWFRPDSKKYMTIEMAEPFVWPENPKSFEAWGKEQRAQEVRNAMDGAKIDHKGQRAQAQTLREQARMLLDRTPFTNATAPSKSTAAKAERIIDEAKRSRVELWELQRTPQVRTSERSDSHTINA